jgi:membrane protease YdiL (CAAX protease family)
MLARMKPPASPPSARKPWRALECALLFIGVPTVVAAGWLPVLVIPLLVLMAIGCGIVLRRRHGLGLAELMRPKVPRQEWQRILAIYLLTVPGLIGLLWLLKPAVLFSLIVLHPKLWLLVIIAYPLLSVLPQELIYRAYFFARYRPLFGDGPGLVLASAGVFAFGHLVFHNWPAVALTFCGGWLFGQTYRRTGSLLAAAVEHALYGCAIFTIGYGQFFFDGTMRLVRGG